jgi:hypothetical protein
VKRGPDALHRIAPESFLIAGWQMFPAIMIAREGVLSWSGDRSKAAGEGLGAWLAKVIQAVGPWISSGIEKGGRWQSEIAERLDEAKVGIVCLTSGHLTAPWILFEAANVSRPSHLSGVGGGNFYVVQHRGIEPTEGFSDLVSGGSQGAVASGGAPLGVIW